VRRKVVGQLKTKPAVIGHSFGGLIAQMVAGEGVAAVTVAINPALKAIYEQDTMSFGFVC